MDRPSGVTKTIVGISSWLRAKAPTLAPPKHKEEFNDNKKKLDNNSKYFQGFFHIYTTN